MALAAGLLGILVGARCGLFGLLAGAVLVGILSQTGLFHQTGHGIAANLGLLAQAVIAFEAAALCTILVRHGRRTVIRRIGEAVAARG